MPGQVDLKVVLLGKEFGGKTSLIERFAYDRFNPYLPYQNTIGGAYLAKKLEIDQKVITIGVWDTAGSERYEAMSRIYYRNAKAAIVCYDMTDKSSFERASYWITELLSCEEGCKVYLCGTKLDLVQNNPPSRAVEIYAAKNYADSINAYHIETSSKTAHGVQELFEQVGKDFINFKMEKSPGAKDQVSFQDSVSLRQKCCSV